MDLIRGVPIIVWLFLLKFGIQIGTFKFSPINAAIIGLGVVSIAYLAEIYRGGLQAVPRGRVEEWQELNPLNLRELVSGNLRRTPGRPCLFNGVGMAWQDLVTATVVYEGRNGQ